MTQKELNLFHPSSRSATQTGARAATKVVRGELREIELGSIFFDDMPPDSLCEAFSPSFSSSTNTSKNPSTSDSSRRKPVVKRLLNAVRIWPPLPTRSTRAQRPLSNRGCEYHANSARTQPQAVHSKGEQAGQQLPVKSAPTGATDLPLLPCACPKTLFPAAAQVPDSASPGLTSRRCPKTHVLGQSEMSLPPPWNNSVGQDKGGVKPPQSKTLRAFNRRHAERRMSAPPHGSCLLLFLLRRVQRAVFCRRRCSLAFMTSFMSPAGRISKTLPYFRAGCWPMSCTA
jgi:hypothetical protein